MKNGIPTNLKGYEVIERIGTGGFGAVYRAKQTTVNREVAVKFIIPSRSNQPDFIRRFETEAHLIARLEHPHITPLFDYWRDPDGAYLVMRYLRGGSVRNVLDNDSYDLESASRLLDQIASALEFAHRHHVIHRDIKPGNILLDEDGNAYLADFGIAKDLNINEGQTSPDTVVGSLDYISPEQARSEPITPRTDIYSLGVMLYEMIVGEHPFKKASSIERLYKHINDPLPEIASLPDDLRDAVNEIIQKATAKDPTQRYEDVLALAVAFRESVGRGSPSQELSVIEQLTLREHEILQFIADGLTNRQISEQLFITVSTVKWHINQLYNKLGVRNRVQAIVRAREMDLIISNREDEALIIADKALSSTSISLPEPENPYKGLHAFQTADARDFYGREDLIQKLVNKMGDDKARFNRFLAVVGPSGSGKSSLVKAGVIPALWKGGLQGSEKWFVVDMMPGTRPLDELEIALIRVAANQSSNLYEQLQRDEYGLVRAAELILPKDDTELVVLVDQFEEVFTLLEDEQQRQHFLNLLLTAATDQRSRVRIIVTLRADYYDKPLHYPEFGEMLRAQMETVLPLSAKGLERAISAPAERVGVGFEPGLVTEIVSEMTYQAGALPLLQYAMTELFERREGWMLTRSAYQEIGGAVGALAKRADEIYLSFDEETQELTRQLFLRLVTLGEGAEDTRRRTERSELLSLSDDNDMTEEVLDAFASHRLLALDHDESTRRPTVEVAHEAILREWERLRQWLNQSRDDIRQERIVAQAAADWKANERDNSYLLSGSRLEQAEQWHGRTELRLTPLENEYLAASLAEREAQEKAEIERQAHEATLEKRAYDRLRTLVAVLLIASFFGILLTIMAFAQRQNAIAARDDAATERDNAELSALESQSVALSLAARQAFDNEERALALALAVEANEMVDEPLPQVHRALVDIAYAPGLRHTIQMEEGTGGTAFSPDGRYFVSSFASLERFEANPPPPLDIIVWDAETFEEVRRFSAADGHAGEIQMMHFSTDGESLFASSSNGAILRWDFETGEILQRYEQDAFAFARRIDIDANGKYLIAGGCVAECGDTDNDIVQLWDVESGELLKSFRNPKFDLYEGLMISPDGESFYASAFDRETGVTSIIRWDIVNNQLIYDVETVTYAGADENYLSEDGSILAFGSSNSQIGLLDTASGEVIRYFNNPINGARVPTVGLSPDGHLLMTGHQDGSIRLWDVATGEEITRFQDHSGFVTRTVFSPDGSQLVSTSWQDGKINIWDIFPANEIQQFSDDAVIGMWDVTISADGKTLWAGVGGDDFPAQPNQSGVIVWDIASGEQIMRFGEDLEGSVAHVRLSPNERFVTTSAYASDQGLGSPDVNAVRLWDAQTGEERQHFVGDDTLIETQFSPDGRTVLTSSYEGFSRLWDAESGVRIRTFLAGNDVLSSAFTPNERTVISGTWDGTLHIWDVETGEKIHQIDAHAGPVGRLHYIAGGRYLVSSSWDGTARLWDTATWEMLRLYEGLDAGNSSVSPDERWLSYGSPDNDVVLIDLDSGEKLAQFSGHTKRVYNTAFSPDGRYLFSASWDGTIRQWEIPPTNRDELVALARANREIPEFTPEQRILYRLDEADEEQDALNFVPVDAMPAQEIAPTATPVIMPTAIPVAQIADVGEQRGEFAVDAANLWTYTGQSGEIITIRIVPDHSGQGTGFYDAAEQGLMYPYLTIYGVNGELMTFVVGDWSETGPGMSLDDLELPEDGTYTIEVRSFAGLVGGAYTLSIESDR